LPIQPHVILNYRLRAAFTRAVQVSIHGFCAACRFDGIVKRISVIDFLDIVCPIFFDLLEYLGRE